MANTCIPKITAEELKSKIKKGEITSESILDMIPEDKIILKQALEEMVAEKFNVSISEGEVSELVTKSKKIDEAQKKLGDDLGNPEKTKETLDFFKAKKEMEDYIMSKNPASKMRVLTGTIGRGMMLASLKSPILNIGSNTEVAITEGLSRRLAKMQFTGTDNSLAMDYVKMVNKIYKETGYDLSRMMDIRDTGASGTRVLEDIGHTQGKGVIRKTGRIVEDIVFKKLMGAPDVAFSSVHFADSVNLNAKKLSNGDNIKAKEIMRDSMRIEPKTPEGIIAREQGIMDAQVATWTNKTWASQLTGGIRNIFNSLSGDARVGDFLFPFIKTPANIIATGMEYAGGGFVSTAVKLAKAIRTGNLADKQNIQSMIRSSIRAGIGMTAAVIITAQLDDDDFVGAYDPKRTQIEGLRNSNTNSIRIGDKWVSVEWLGPLAVPVTSIMFARKYGDTPAEQAFQYGKGVWAQLKNLPTVSDVFEYAQNQSYGGNKNLKEMTGETVNWLAEQAGSRLIPSFVSDIAKATDEYNRVAKTGLEGVQAKIPGLRQNLPIRTNIFGEKSKTEQDWSVLLFGSRLKTDQETRMIKELSRLSTSTDKGITFMDWDKSSSSILAEFKQKVGETKFKRAKADYQKTLKVRLEDAIKKSVYRSASDEDKLLAINNLDSEITKLIYKKYGFKHKPVKNKKIKI